MITTVSLKTRHSMADTKPVILEALSGQLAFARARHLKFERECKGFEIKYKMDSDSFLEKFESGEMGDETQWFDWYAAIRGKTIWGKKYQILNEITWPELPIKYVTIDKDGPVALKYRFQLQNPKGEFAARWDNAPHHKEIGSFPHHKHCRTGNTIGSPIRNILQMLNSLDTEMNDSVEV